MAVYIEIGHKHDVLPRILRAYGGRILQKPPKLYADVPKGQKLVVVTDYGTFERAAICYNEVEFFFQTRPDELNPKQFMLLRADIAAIAADKTRDDPPAEEITPPAKRPARKNPQEVKDVSKKTRLLKEIGQLIAASQPSCSCAGCTNYKAPEVKSSKKPSVKKPSTKKPSTKAPVAKSRDVKKDVKKPSTKKPPKPPKAKASTKKTKANVR